MANTLNTRISLKYDTYANWTSNNPTLLKGEAAIVVIPDETNAVANEPIVLLKIGDGTTSFNELGFTGGVAADVYDWAKESTKPKYSATEIDGLEAYISGKVEDTNTVYQLVKDPDNPHKIKLQSHEKGVEEWTDVTTIETADTVYDDSELKELIGETSVADQIAAAIAALDLANSYDAKGTAATEAGKVQSALDSYKTSNDAVVKAIKDGASIDSFKDVETALEGKQAVGDYATKTEAQGYADAKDAAIAAAKKAGDDAQSAVDELTTTVGGKANKANSLAGYGIQDAYTKGDADAAIASAVASAGHLKREIVTDLPAPGAADKDTIYMKKDDDVESGDAYKEYMLIEGALVQIGDTSVDLTPYAKSSDVTGQIQSAKTEAASDATTKANAAETKAKSYADGLAEDINSQLAKKANTSDLADIAKSGDVKDLKQASGYVILNCGSATVNIAE